MTSKRLILSEKLVTILHSIRESSKVARQLLDIHYGEEIHETLDDMLNYIDLSKDCNNMLSYLTLERISQLGNDDNILWNSNRRYRARPTVVVSKILKNISGRDLEIFSNVFRSVVATINFRFVVVKGNELRKWYSEQRIARERGSLYHSCMKHDFCQRFMQIYTENSDKISMLVMLEGKPGQDDSKSLLGRALLWQFDEFKVMDRIYCVNDEEYSFHFKKWANDNGYLYKAEQRWNNTQDFIESGQRVIRKFSVKLANWKFDSYPYLDTFKFLDLKNGIISNHKTDDTDCILMGSDGSYVSKNHLVEDYITGYYHNPSEMVDILYDSETLTWRKEPKFVHESSAQFSHILDKYILKSDAKIDDIICDVVFKKELDKLNDKKKIIQAAKMAINSEFSQFIRLLVKNGDAENILSTDYKSVWRENSSKYDYLVDNYYQTN